MDHYDRVAAIFQSHIEHVSLSVDAVAEVTGAAAELASTALLEERKVYSVGLGLDASTAIIMADLLRNGLEMERPPLPVIELTVRHGDSASATDWTAGQLRALCQPGDLVVIFASQLEEPLLQQLAQAVAPRDADAVWLGANGPIGMSLDYGETPMVSQLLLNQAAALSIAILIDELTFGGLEE